MVGRLTPTDMEISMTHDEFVNWLGTVPGVSDPNGKPDFRNPGFIARGG